MKKEEKHEEFNGNHNGNGNNGRKITRHHLIPRSRGGADKKNNIVKIPERYHNAWHTFFGNLTPKEAIQFILTIFMTRSRRRDKWTVETLYDLQLELQWQFRKK